MNERIRDTDVEDERSEGTAGLHVDRETARSLTGRMAARSALFDTRVPPMERLCMAPDAAALRRTEKREGELPSYRSAAEAMVHETSFFRDVQPFELLRLEALPRLVERRRGARQLRVWSAGCSTGQEAYSVAMLLSESFPELAEWDVRIVGTDVSRLAVEYARRAVYCRAEVNRGLPAKMLMKYMTRDGEGWKVCRQIREMCEFRRADLCGDLSEMAEFDVVLLRNVLLYLAPMDRQRLFERVSGRMRGDGILVLGSAEQAEESTDLFEVEFAAGCYFYRLVNAG